MQVVDELVKALAGARYQELITNQDKALAGLLDISEDVAFASLIICESTWKCLDNPRFIDACRELIAKSSAENIRVRAIDALRVAMQGSRSQRDLALLASLIGSPDSTPLIWHAAYWAIKDIDIGLSHHENIQRLISMISFSRDAVGAPTRTVIDELVQSSSVDVVEPESFDWSYIRSFLPR